MLSSEAPLQAVQGRTRPDSRDLTGGMIMGDLLYAGGLRLELLH